MIFGEFEYIIDFTNNLEKTASIKKGPADHFLLDKESIYQLEFIIQDIKRKLNLE